jgi:HNH endonuclease
VVCGNPLCGRRIHLHGHHLQARSKGGRTAFYNEVAVCERCHSLVELGYLKVAGDPARGLAWTTRADAISRELAAEAAEVAAIPVVAAAVSRYPENRDSRDRVSRYPENGDRVSRYLENREGGPGGPERASAEDRKHLDDCVRALRVLGSTPSEAVRCARRAFEKLCEDGQPIGVEALIKLACRY